jgi:hypothetical protein
MSRARLAICMLLSGCATSAGAAHTDTSPTRPAATQAAPTPAASAHVTTDGLPPEALLAFLGGGAASGAGGGISGTWAYAAGSTTRTCPGEVGTDAPPEGNLVLTAGSAPSEIAVIEPGACTLRFSRAGNVATVVAGQTCAGPDGAGGTITFSKMTWTLTLSADGQTLAEALSADETLAPAHGAARTCKFTERGVTLRRAP